MVVKKTLTVPNEAGFHVRVASLVCETAKKYASTVNVSKGSYVADAKCCMDLLGLMCPKGSVVTVSAEGDDAELVMNEIQSLFDHKFYEDEFKPKS